MEAVCLSAQVKGILNINFVCLCSHQLFCGVAVRKRKKREKEKNQVKAASPTPTTIQVCHPQGLRRSCRRSGCRFCPLSSTRDAASWSWCSLGSSGGHRLLCPHWLCDSDGTITPCSILSSPELLFHTVHLKSCGGYTFSGLFSGDIC